MLPTMTTHPSQPEHVPNVHPHSANEWSPSCIACPPTQPAATVLVELDAALVERMTAEASAALPGDRTVTLVRPPDAKPTAATAHTP